MAWARVTVGTWNPVEDAPARDAMEKATVNMITSLTLKLALKMIREAVCIVHVKSYLKTPPTK